MDNAKEKKSEMNERALKRIREEIEKIQYGSVTAVIQEGKIVQLDTNIKTRLI